MAEGFIIERSDNGSSGWAEVDRVPLSETSYTDAGQTGTKFYRIKEYNDTTGFTSGPSNVDGAEAAVGDTINMSDGAPSPQTEGTPNQITFTIASSGTPPLSADVTGTWSTENGTAVAGQPGDFVGVTGAPFTIPAATGTVNITVDMAAADTVWAPDRSFTARIVTADAPIGDDTGTGTITDSLTEPTAAVADGVPNPQAAGSPITFIISITQAAKYDIHVPYTTADDTAIAGTDYTAASGTAIIPAGQTSVQVPVQTL